MRAVVTGGRGFVGGAIRDLLGAGGHAVTVVDSLDPRVHSGGSPPRLRGAFEIRGDIRTAAVLQRALRGAPEVVFHEAAMVGLGRGAADVEEFLSVNVSATATLVRALARLPRPPRLILGSSMAVVGEGLYECVPCGERRRARRPFAQLRARRWEPLCEKCGAPLRPLPVTEDTVPLPETYYARSKLLQEQVALDLGRELGVGVTALRYHNVYGPGMPRNTVYAGVAAMFKSQLREGRAPIVHEDGRQLRDFIHVDDVARANLLAAEAPPEAAEGCALNVATGAPTEIRQLARTLARLMAPELRPRFPGTFRAGDARHVFGSTTAAERTIGFRARVPLAEGLRQFARERMRAPARAGGVP